MAEVDGNPLDDAYAQVDGFQSGR